LSGSQGHQSQLNFKGLFTENMGVFFLKCVHSLPDIESNVIIMLIQTDRETDGLNQPTTQTAFK